MSDTPICPECGARLSASTPAGYARCLMNAAATASTMSHQPLIAPDVKSAEGELFEGTPAMAGRAGGTMQKICVPPARLARRHQVPPTNLPAHLSVETFKRVIVELGIAQAAALDRCAGAAVRSVSELARSLVQSRLLTWYQAHAIEQGKARGLLVGRYLILDKLGQGGMGVVFKARHRLLDRVVALKILPPSFARERELVLRFRREMQAAARLNHPNVVSVLDADEDRGVHFLAMDYIEGRDLSHLIRERGPFSVEQTLDCVIQAASGIEAAHNQGIVHRDIKPSNLILDGSGTVHVLDLGLARLVNPASPLGENTAARLTQSGAFMGTVDFMAPEQAEDSQVSTTGPISTASAARFTSY